MSLRTMMATSEMAIQKSMTRPRRSVHQDNFLWALCQEFVLSTTQRFAACSVAGLPFSVITPVRPRASSFSRVAFGS